MERRVGVHAQWRIATESSMGKSSHFDSNFDQRGDAAKYGTFSGFVAAWAPAIAGLAFAGPVGAIAGIYVGNKLARKIDLGSSTAKYDGES